MPSKPQHRPTGEVCDRCGLRASRHMDRSQYNRGYLKEYNRAHPRIAHSERIIGIDGEGSGRRPHRYDYLAASDEAGESWSVDGNPGRLSTAGCLDFLLALPLRSLVFGFAFLYDLTKWVADLPDRSIFLLFHEKRRARFIDGRVVYMPVVWGEYRLNYMNRRFSVRRGKRRATVWDIFAFFQSKFVKALEDWKIGDATERNAIERMKEKRSILDQLPREQVHAYCQAECKNLATLGRSLIEAHTDAGLKLRTYFGAGSTASVLLSTFGIREKRGDVPEPMREPVACAFFGGRFENSVIGAVRGRVFNHDISSAYPYQATFLPCLQHGRWEFLGATRGRNSGLNRRIETATLALVHWSIRPIIDAPWGVLPVRKADGTIAFPLSADGGWTWRDEFIAARRINEHVEAKEAWIYNTDCDCRPFEKLPWYYNERCRIGKEGKGIVFKLGPNSVYGKLAQSRGLNPPFQSWVWAGNITSGCRGQLLDALATARQASNVLMLATDGVWSREELSLPQPRDTGTSATGKPLGGWETKAFDRGVFAVRPGIYFPLEPTEDELEKVRARGLGRRVLYEQWPKIVEAFEQGRTHVEIGGMTRFVGAKLGVTWSPKQGAKRSPDYGEWIDHSVMVSFDPKPKREHQLADGTLTPWKRFDFPSMPYDNAIKSEEAKALELAALIAEEQPNADFADLSIIERE
jgi:hypothetical protein